LANRTILADYLLRKNNSGDIKILGRQREEERNGKKKYEERQRRITGLYAFRRPIRAAPGFGSARSVAWLLPTPGPHPQFVGPAFASQTRIRAAKPSHTAGTLYAMVAEIFVNITSKPLT
jgi:hypothetical protein